LIVEEKGKRGGGEGEEGRREREWSLAAALKSCYCFVQINVIKRNT
jgi:hypothetical protein